MLESPVRQSAFPGRSQMRATAARFFRAYGIVVVAIFTMLILGLFRPNFLAAQNLSSLLYGVSLDFYVVVGFTILLIMGELDLSVGSVYALSGLTAGYLATKGLPLPLCLAVALGIGASVGLINGLLVVKLRINSIILTIGTLLAVRGLADVVATLMAGKRYAAGFREVPHWRILGVSWTVIVMVLAVGAVEFFMSRGAGIRSIYYIGQNAKSAAIHGVAVDRFRLGAFILSGLLSACAGFLVAGRISIPDVNMGRQLEFTILTAAVLGGASLFGGRGRVVNSVVALFVLAMIINGLIMLGIEPVLQQVIVGAILVIIVIVDTRFSREASR
jgi:ribose/xylose/arabinose/galactoside ABC-type transport system permease subunit